jgi:hypothetical protein
LRQALRGPALRHQSLAQPLPRPRLVLQLQDRLLVALATVGLNPAH